MISPTVDTTPGTGGGFPRQRATALKTPIVLQVTHGTPGLTLSITAKYYGNPNPTDDELVYLERYYGVYAGSDVVSDDDSVTFTIRRNGGWTGAFIVFSVVATDGEGNRQSADLTWELPQTFIEEEDTSSVSTFNHVSTALSRLPSQFRS